MLKRTVIVGSLILSLVAVVFAAIYVTRETSASQDSETITATHDAEWSIQPGTTAEWKSGVSFKRNTSNSNWNGASFWTGAARDDKTGYSGSSLSHSKTWNIGSCSNGGYWYKPYSWISIKDSYGNYYNNTGGAWPRNDASGDAIYVGVAEVDDHRITFNQGGTEGFGVIHDAYFRNNPSGASYTITSELYRAGSTLGPWSKISTQTSSGTTSGTACDVLNGTDIFHPVSYNAGYVYKAKFYLSWSISSPVSQSKSYTWWTDIRRPGE